MSVSSVGCNMRINFWTVVYIKTCAWSALNLEVAVSPSPSWPICIMLSPQKHDAEGTTVKVSLIFILIVLGHPGKLHRKTFYLYYCDPDVITTPIENILSSFSTTRKWEFTNQGGVKTEPDQIYVSSMSSSIFITCIRWKWNGYHLYVLDWVIPTSSNIFASGFLLMIKWWLRQFSHERELPKVLTMWSPYRFWLLRCCVIVCWISCKHVNLMKTTSYLLKVAADKL